MTVRPISTGIEGFIPQKKVKPNSDEAKVDKAGREALKKRSHTKVVESSKLKRAKRSDGPWAKIKNTSEGVRYTFSNGTVVLEKPTEKFARFVKGAPVLRPEPHSLDTPDDIDEVLAEIRERGFSAVRIMPEEEADVIYQKMCEEYRKLLLAHPSKLQKANPGFDLNTIELADLPKGLYSGRAGSGKLNANGFVNAESAWEVRHKTAEVFKQIFTHHLGETTPVMSSPQFVFAWGPNLVKTLPKVEHLPRAYPHLDYNAPLTDGDQLIRPGIQSIVVLTKPDRGTDPNIDQTTATAVFPRSHKYYEEIRKRTADPSMRSKGAIPWKLLVEMVNEGKIDPPERVAVSQGCCLLWSRLLPHSPHSWDGKRVAMREAILPTKEVPISNRLKNLLCFFTHNPTAGVEAQRKIKVLTLYNRRGSQIWREMGWAKLPGVDPKFYTVVKEKTNKEFHELRVGDLKKLFKPHELLSYFSDKKQAEILGFVDPEEIKNLKGWNQKP